MSGRLLTWARALPPPPADVLEVGRGTGQVAVLLAELGHRVTGIDLADGMLRVARAKAATIDDPPDFRIGDAVAPQFAPASFDAVTSRYLLWTLREPERALGNWHTLLRSRGVLVAIDGNWFAGGADRDEDDEDVPDREEFAKAYDQTRHGAPPARGGPRHGRRRGHDAQRRVHRRARDPAPADRAAPTRVAPQPQPGSQPVRDHRADAVARIR